MGGARHIYHILGDALNIYYMAPGAIIVYGDHNEVHFTIARTAPCEVRFGLFLAQFAPFLKNKKRVLYLRLDLDKHAGLRHFQMFVLLKNRRKMIYIFLMLLLQSSFRALMSSICHSSLPAHHFKFGWIKHLKTCTFYILEAEAFQET